MVPLPPTLKRPKRANGAEQMVMFGVSLRMTITLEGSEGMSLDVMMRWLSGWIVGRDLVGLDLG